MEGRGADHSDAEERRKPKEGESDEEMECEEETESSDMSEQKMDSSDKVTGAEKMLQPSRVASDKTSGIGMKGESTTSPPATRAPVEAPVSAAVTQAGPSAASEPRSAKSKEGLLHRTWNFITAPLRKDTTSPKDSTTRPKDSKTPPKPKPGKILGRKGKKPTSPPQRPQESAAVCDERTEPVGEGACAAVPGNEEEPFKKGGEKKKTLSRILSDTIRAVTKKGGPVTDTEGLVPNEEDTRTTPVTSPAEAQDMPLIVVEDETNTLQLIWSEDRTSVTSRISTSATEMTDAPSTLDTKLSPRGSRKTSVAGESTSEEAVAGSLASSSAELVPEIRVDKPADSPARGTPVKRGAEDTDFIHLESDEVFCSPRKRPNREESSTDISDEVSEVTDDTCSGT